MKNQINTPPWKLCEHIAQVRIHLHRLWCKVWPRHALSAPRRSCGQDVHVQPSWPSRGSKLDDNVGFMTGFTVSSHFQLKQPPWYIRIRLDNKVSIRKSERSILFMSLAEFVRRIRAGKINKVRSCDSKSSGLNGSCRSVCQSFVQIVSWLFKAGGVLPHRQISPLPAYQWPHTHKSV